MIKVNPQKFQKMLKVLDKSKHKVPQRKLWTTSTLYLNTDELPTEYDYGFSVQVHMERIDEKTWNPYIYLKNKKYYIEESSQ